MTFWHSALPCVGCHHIILSVRIIISEYFLKAILYSFNRFPKSAQTGTDTIEDWKTGDEATMKCHSIPIVLAEFRKVDHIKCWWRCRADEISYSVKETRRVLYTSEQAWPTECHFQLNALGYLTLVPALLNMFLPYNLAIPFLGFFISEKDSHRPWGTYPSLKSLTDPCPSGQEAYHGLVEARS